jgi:nicotinamidase/pyrazinamidase
MGASRDIQAHAAPVKVIIVVDVIDGFCTRGALASERLRRVVPAIRDHLERETAAGAKVVFLADTHTADDREFAMFPPHCVVGSGEEEVVAELRPFLAGAVLIPKRRYSGFFGTRLDEVLEGMAPGVVEVVGVCTDICVLHTVADLRNRDYDVVVRADLVETYDAPGHVADDVNRFAIDHMRDVLGARIVDETTPVFGSGAHAVA